MSVKIIAAVVQFEGLTTGWWIESEGYIDHEG
jgi:hypothetical protein